MNSRVNKFINRYYGSNHAAKVIYGTILIFVVLIGLSASRPSSAAAAALETFIAALVLVLTEDYAEMIGYTIKHKRALSKQERHEIFDDTFAIATFSMFPSVILLISTTGIYSLTTAFNLAFGFCMLVLFIFSYWAGRLSNFSRYKALLMAVLTACIGIVIILIKYQVSH